MKMTKEKSWLFAALGVVAILFVSGAFKEFIGWSDDEHKWGGGAFTAGAGIAGSILAHKFGVIDGNTRNVLIAASLASGATTAFGDKVEDFGAELAAKMKGKSKSGVKGRRGLTGRTGAPVDPNAGVSQGTPEEIDVFNFTQPAQQPVAQQPVAAAPPIPQQQPVQQVIHQPAPQQSSGSSTAQLIGSILGPLAQFGSAWVSSTAGPSTIQIGVPGSAGSGRVRMGAFN